MIVLCKVAENITDYLRDLIYKDELAILLLCNILIWIFEVIVWDKIREDSSRVKDHSIILILFIIFWLSASILFF